MLIVSRMQLLSELVNRIANDGRSWLDAVTETGLDKKVFELLRAPARAVPSAAAVFGALANHNAPGIAARMLSPRLPDLVAVLSAGLSARGSAADEALRFECMLSLAHLVVTQADRDTAAQLGLARACALLREADLEAEQMALLDLLAIICVDSPRHARQVTFCNILPRLQQLMTHPDRTIQRSAVRPVVVSMQSLSLFCPVLRMSEAHSCTPVSIGVTVWMLHCWEQPAMVQLRHGPGEAALSLPTAGV